MNEEDISRVIEMAREDRTPFEAIEKLYGLSEDEVIRLMRCELRTNSFKVWRSRVSGRVTKHKRDIVATAVAAGSFNTRATALTEAGLIETLKRHSLFFTNR